MTDEKLPRVWQTILVENRPLGNWEKASQLSVILKFYSPCETVFYPNPPAHNRSSDEREHNRGAIGVDMRFHQGPILSPCQKSGEVRCDVLVGEMAENARLVPPTPS